MAEIKVSDSPVEVDTPKLPRTESRWVTLRRWLIRATLAVAIVAPLVFAVAALGAKLGLWGFGTGFAITRNVGPLLLIAAIVLGLLTALFALLVKPRRGLVVAVLALVVGLVGFGRLSQVRNTVASLPFIHDITTDTQDPPTFGSVIMAERAATEGVNTVDYAGKTAPATLPDGSREERLVSALQTQSYPEVRTLVLSEPPAAVFGRAEAAARDMGWAIKETDEAAGRIDATETTFWYGFKDDVTIRLRPAAGGGTRVDVRSVSRVGGSDLGANAKRVEAFLDAMQE